MDDLHMLPKVRDSLSYLYVEHAVIEQHQRSIAILDMNGLTPVPAAALLVLMLGPGTKITQAAVKTLAEFNCLIIWCGEENVRFYAQGMGGTRSAAALLHQAALVSDPGRRLDVVRRMYRMRFDEDPGPGATIERLRGMEGMRVRSAYHRLAEEYGVEWTGRNYERNSWESADPLNRALSCANSCLYGICQAAILASGYSPALGFVHTGKQMSFVYDIADLYKVDVTIPLAFQAVAEGTTELERSVRLRARDSFRQTRLLQRIVPDLQRVLDAPPELAEAPPFDSDPALPNALWSPSEDAGEEDES